MRVITTNNANMVNEIKAAVSHMSDVSVNVDTENSSFITFDGMQVTWDIEKAIESAGIKLDNCTILF